jgi:hypothetical protein
MRLRCPHHGCSIEVADDMLGARIRCPHCQELLFVDPQYQENAAEQAEANDPSTAVEPVPDDSADLDKRLYAGIPPLSLMLAVREGRAPAWDDRAIRAQMTDDDWKALAAFEKALYATVALQQSLWTGMIVAVLTVLSWLAVGHFSDGTVVSPSRTFSWAGTLVMVSTGFLLMELGRRRLQRLQVGSLTELAAWAALVVALAFTVNALLSLSLLFGNRAEQAVAGLVLLAAPFQLLAAIGAGWTCLKVHRALHVVGVPEILQRLTAALQYLD